MNFYYYGLIIIMIVVCSFFVILFLNEIKNEQDKMMRKIDSVLTTIEIQRSFNPTFIGPEKEPLELNHEIKIKKPKFKKEGLNDSTKKH